MLSFMLSLTRLISCIHVFSTSVTFDLTPSISIYTSWPGFNMTILSKAKGKYRGMFEIQKSVDKTSLLQWRIQKSAWGGGFSRPEGANGEGNGRGPLEKNTPTPHQREGCPLPLVGVRGPPPSKF